MKQLSYLTTALCMLLLLGGCDRYQDSIQELTCGTQYVLCSPLIANKCQSCPNQDERCLDRTTLEDQGERYTRRGDYSADISQFSPRDGESYETYYARMMNTLTLQVYNIESLEQALEEKEASLGNLQSQVQTISEQESLMRLTLSNYETNPHIAKGDKKKNNPRLRPFEKYIVKNGDTLQKISMEAYGTYTGWLAIYRFNLKKMRYGPNRLETGTVLYIPNVDLVNLTPVKTNDLDIHQL